MRMHATGPAPAPFEPDRDQPRPERKDFPIPRRAESAGG